MRIGIVLAPASSRCAQSNLFPAHASGDKRSIGPGGRVAVSLTGNPAIPHPRAFWATSALGSDVL